MSIDLDKLKPGAVVRFKDATIKSVGHQSVTTIPPGGGTGNWYAYFTDIAEIVRPAPQPIEPGQKWKWKHTNDEAVILAVDGPVAWIKFKFGTRGEHECDYIRGCATLIPSTDGEP